MSQQTISNPSDFPRRLGKNFIKPQDICLPSLKNFNMDDIKKIKEKSVSFLANLSPEDKLYSLLKVPIKKKYLTKLEEDNEIHHNLFVFFFRYLVYLQKFEPHQKTYILALEIDEYKDLEKLKYSFLPGLENIYEKFEELNDFEYLLYIVRIDGRWVIEIIRRSDKKPFLIDFIIPMLSNVNHLQLHGIISKIHQVLFLEALTEDYVLLDKLISREINDYSIYACFISYYVTMNQDWKDVKENIGNLSEDEMKSFINKILWIIYTVIMKNYLLKENTIINNNNNNNEIIQINQSAVLEPKNKSFIDSKPNGYYLKKNIFVPIRNSLEKNGCYSLSQKTLVDLLKQTKTEILEEVSKKKTYSDLDKFIDEELPKDPRIKLPHLDDFHLKFSRNELKEILLKYGEKFKEKKSTKTNESYTKEAEFHQNYNNFNYLLWYYYNYDPDMYKTLIEEYNNRLHNQMLTSLGLHPLPPKLQIIQTSREELHHSPTLNSKKVHIPQYNVSVLTEPSYNESIEKTGNSMNMGVNLKNQLVGKPSSMLNNPDNPFLSRRSSKAEIMPSSHPNFSKIISYQQFNKIMPISPKTTTKHFMGSKNNNIDSSKLFKALNNNKDSNIDKSKFFKNHNSHNNNNEKALQNILKFSHSSLDPNINNINHRKSKSFQPTENLTKIESSLKTVINQQTIVSKDKNIENNPNSYISNNNIHPNISKSDNSHNNNSRNPTLELLKFPNNLDSDTSRKSKRKHIKSFFKPIKFTENLSKYIP